MSRLSKVEGVRVDCACKRSRHEHGTYAAYNRDRCRCRPCRDANNLVNDETRMREAKRFWAGEVAMVDACGARRRLQALAVVGWSAKEIAERLGVSQQAVAAMRDHYGLGQSPKSERIKKVYDDLWDKKPTVATPMERAVVDRVIKLARSKGWAPPMAWDDDKIDDPDAKPSTAIRTREHLDEIAIAEALAGRRVTLTKAETREAVRRAAAAKIPSWKLGESIGLTARSIERYKAVAA